MNMEELMAQANALQEKVSAAQEKLGQMHIKGIADGGACIIDLSGKYDLFGLTIREDALSRGAAGVASLVTAAYNDAKNKVDKTIDEVMGTATAGMPIPE